MSYQKYIIGTKSNRLTIIEEAPRELKSNRMLRMIKCKCDCGVICTITAQSFKRTISCGCHIKEDFLQKTNCKPGDIFGRITVIGLCETPKYKRRYVKCKCTCGNIKIIRAANLASGATISCGCYNKEIVTANLLEWKSVNQPSLKYFAGHIFGKLKVLEIIRDKNKAKCICECGTIRIVGMASLADGSIMSCKACQNFSNFKPLIYWELDKRQYAKRANKKELKFELTIEEFINLVQSNCHYCGAIPNGKTHSKYLKRNGIDRVDNAVGYIIENCVPCCAMCNASKSNKTLSQFLEWIKRVFYKNYKE
jgi:hypothetical protein